MRGLILAIVAVWGAAMIWFSYACGGDGKPGQGDHHPRPTPTAPPGYYMPPECTEGGWVDGGPCPGPGVSPTPEPTASATPTPTPSPEPTESPEPDGGPGHRRCHWDHGNRDGRGARYHCVPGCPHAFLYSSW